MDEQKVQDEIATLKQKDYSLFKEMDYYVEKFFLIPKILLIFLMLWWGVQQVIQDKQQFILGIANFFTHESGHFIFMPFGRFMTVLGGNLFETLVPTIGMLFCAYKRWYFFACVFLFWMGVTLIDASIYIADARARVLPLVIWTGTRSTSDSHDWTYILTDLGLLDKDLFIASIVKTTGKTFVIAAIFLGIVAFFTSLRRILTDKSIRKNNSTEEISVYK